MSGDDQPSHLRPKRVCTSVSRVPARYGTGTVGGDPATWWTLAPVAGDARWHVLVWIPAQGLLLEGSCTEREDADAFLAMNIDVATEVW